MVETNFLAQYAPPVHGAAAHLFWVRGESLVTQRFDAAKLRLEGDVVPVADVVGTGALSFAHFSVSNTGVLMYGTGVLGKRQMEWRDRKGIVLGTEGQAGVYYSPRISPDGSAVALSRVHQSNSDMWLYEFGRRVMTRLTVDPGFDNYPVWSPDRRRLAFSAARGAARNLHLTHIGGGLRNEQITESPHSQFPTDWSRDGRYLLYTEAHPKTSSDIWLLSFQEDTGKPKTEPFLATQFDEMNARFSPDGRWIVYSSNESGAYEVYVQPFPAGGKKWLVSNQRGSQPIWRGERELLYVAADGRLMTVDVTPAAGGLSFSIPHELFRAPVRLGVPYYDYQVTADGQRFFILAPAAGGTPEPLNVLINRYAALRP